MKGSYTSIMNRGGDGPDGAQTILLDCSKNEIFTPSNGLKSLQRKLKGLYKTTTCKDEIGPDRLEGHKVCMFVGPRTKFKADEFDAMKSYMEGGGSILITLGEGGETRYDTNVNFFLEEYGIAVCNDAIVRSSYYKYHHPKECVVTGGVLNREIERAAGKQAGKQGAKQGGQPAAASALTFLYPFGATLSVQKPAVPVLSSGNISLPVNRPICAFYETKNGSGGRLAVLGSSHMLSDQYLGKEENGKVFDVLMKWLTDKDFKLNAIDAEDPEVSDYHFLPSTAKCAEQLRTCLQESDEVPKDVQSLFDRTLFNIDTSILPEAVGLYDKLGVPQEPLSLITPQFETPLPPLQPAVFPPTFREPEPPQLDLFDLDEAFSSERVRLAQLTNKCNDDDLEYFIRECGEILSVSHKLDADKRDGKHILEHIFRQVVDFKKTELE